MTPEKKKKMQLARARKILRKYEEENDCVPGKRCENKKNCRASGQDTTTVQDGQLPKGSEEPVEDPLTEKVELLQGILVEIKEKVKQHNREACSLRQQQNQYLHHLQQGTEAGQTHLAACQQLALEKEQLHQQMLLQNQLLHQLQQENRRQRSEIDQVKQELREVQDQLKTSQKQNQQLQAQLNAVIIPIEEDEELKNEQLDKVTNLDKEEAESVAILELTDEVNESHTWEITETLLQDSCILQEDLSGQAEDSIRHLENETYMKEAPAPGTTAQTTTEGSHLGMNDDPAKGLMSYLSFIPFFYRSSGTDKPRIIII